MLKKQWVERTVTFSLLSVILACLIVEILLNLTPPISRDALIHHLAIPKLWLLHGGIYEIPWAGFSYYPMNIDLLYLVPLYFKNDIIPKFIHLAFGVGIGLLIYYYLKNRFSKIWGLLGFLIFFSTPAVVRLSTTAYIDLGMTFFTTAAILAFIKWWDDDYRGVRWLILSAVCMGLAAGSKYNALIAWFFLNSMIVFYCSRDTGKGLPALKFGVIFFIVTLLIVSPWYIKNCILTGNPIYPLFDNYFKLLHHAGNEGGGIAANPEAAWASSIFQRRAMMFGEGFWEIILIPVRIFFQGKDGSSQYFEGVLNPILIIMLPFAFLKNRLSRDKLLFFLFSIFFFLIAYFLTVIRVRYILPIIPLLTILSVLGIKNIGDWINECSDAYRHIVIPGISVVIVILISLNILYVKEYFNTIRPIDYIFQRETKDEFLNRHIGSYSAMQYINKNLPDDSKILLMFIGRRGYYLDRPYRHDASFGMTALSSMVKASRDKSDFQALMQSLDCTHILMQTDFFSKYLHDNYPEETIIHFVGIVKEHWKPIYGSKGYVVYKIF